MDKKAERDDAIKTYYRKLSSKKEFGVQKFTSVWCMQKVANKFYLNENTVRKIISS